VPNAQKNKPHSPNNIQVRAMHISGVQNELADCLSRFQMDRFKKLAPMADQTPSDIPAEFWSMISNEV
jgi:hypothetical protein